MFLSRRRGAILLRLEAGAEQDLAALSLSADLSYKTPAGVPVTEHLALGFDGQDARDERGHWYAQRSVGRSIALALLVSGMRDAATGYANDRSAAATRMRAALERFRADATALGDEDLAPEVKLAEDLLALMERGANQGSLYGMR